MLDTPTIDKFQAGLRGELIRRADPQYEEARKLYNAMIDKRPLLIARCADVADVISAVNFARENNLASIIGEKTAGRLLSATSVKVGHGFRLALPTGAYYTWKGWILEGSSIVPDKLVEFDWRRRRAGIDDQLERAVELLRSQLTARAS